MELDLSSTNARAPARKKIYEPKTFSRRTRARFVKNRTEALIAHLGREPSFAERVLISRCCANEFDLRRLDHALDAGTELNGHSARLRLALENRLRLDLAALGLRTQPKPEPRLADWIGESRARAGATASP